MPDLDRTVGGLRCRDVLALLAGYVDRELPPGQVEQVDDHLAGCDHCEKFGGEYGALVGALRRGLARHDPSDELRRRLVSRFADVLSAEGR